MVEHHHDRSWLNHIKLNNDEFDKWLLCHNTLGVVDPIHNKRGSHDNNWFTLSYCKLGEDRKLNRLDKFYISLNLFVTQESSGVVVRVDYSSILSDHYPIISCSSE